MVPLSRRRSLEKEKALAELVSEFAKQPAGIQAQILDVLTFENTQAGEFFCNVLGCMISVPCSAKACHYHSGTGKTSHNCLLKYKFDKGNEALSVDVISDVTDIPESRIRASIEKAFNRVRAHTLMCEINNGKYNRFRYYGGVKVCVVCGSTTPKKPFRVDETCGLEYCSRTCYKKKPPSLVKLEMHYAADIRVILSVAKKTLKKLPLISSALEVKRRLLVKWYEDYLGLHPSVFGADAVEFGDLIRRTQPRTSWAADFLSNLYNKQAPQVNTKLLDMEQECKKLCRSL